MNDQVFKAIHNLGDLLVGRQMDVTVGNALISLLFWTIWKNNPTDTTCELIIEREFDTPLPNCLSVVVGKDGRITEWYYGKTRPGNVELSQILHQDICIEDLCSVINKMYDTNLIDYK